MCYSHLSNGVRNSSNRCPITDPITAMGYVDHLGLYFKFKRGLNLIFFKKTGIKLTFDYKRIRFQVDENGVHVGRDTKNWGNCGPDCQIPDRGMY